MSLRSLRYMVAHRRDHQYMLDARENGLQTRCAVCLFELPQQHPAFCVRRGAFLAKIEYFVYIKSMQCLCLSHTYTMQALAFFL